ncbi:PEP-CTERM sorting domain-containing protein [Edaphobacter bradus]|uniref:PEP-CTERM sorting domain-containing protein n=1 Tax=Edaphobacter bradus TaxID=2259016 RepID=UPI0021DFED34|nr:PEP-CTERM sorting domain-containing protein [Edaphobacter bradus]
MINQSKWIFAGILCLALPMCNPALADTLPPATATQILTVIGGPVGGGGVYQGFSPYGDLVVHSAGFIGSSSAATAETQGGADPTAMSRVTISGQPGGTGPSQSLDSRTIIRYELEVNGPAGTVGVNVAGAGDAYASGAFSNLGSEAIFTVSPASGPAMIDDMACAGDTSSLVNPCSGSTSFNVNTTLQLQTNTAYVVNLLTESHFSIVLSGGNPNIGYLETFAGIDPTFTLATTDPDYSLSFSPGLIPDTTPTPEPSSLALLSTGALGAFCTFRRRRGRYPISRRLEVCATAKA